MEHALNRAAPRNELIVSLESSNLSISRNPSSGNAVRPVGPKRCLGCGPSFPLSAYSVSSEAPPSRSLNCSRTWDCPHFVALPCANLAGPCSATNSKP